MLGGYQIADQQVRISLCCDRNMVGNQLKKCVMISRCYNLLAVRWKSTTRTGRKPANILFFGTDDFSVKHLQALQQNRNSPDSTVDRIGVVVPKIHRSSNKRCAVEKYAREKEIKLMEWPLQIEHELYDLGVVVSFGHLIPQGLIESFPSGVINVHPSLLPRWRGAAPIQHTILSGDRHTAVSVMQIMPQRFDVGPILAQHLCDVPHDPTLPQLQDILAAKGSSLLIEVVRDLRKLPLKALPQATSGATHAFKLTTVHTRINWEQQTICDIDRQYRALGTMYDLRSEFEGNPIRLMEMVAPDHLAHILPSIEGKSTLTGSMYYDKSNSVLCIKCKNGYVGFQGIVLKKPMSAKAFYNGYLSKSKYKGAQLRSLDNHLSKYFQDSDNVD